MAEVHFISSALVLATTHKVENLRVELTPWDLQLLLVNPIQKGLLFPKPKLSQKNETENTFLHHLKDFLSHTPDYFAPFGLTGRLATIEFDSDTISIFFLLIVIMLEPCLSMLKLME